MLSPDENSQPSEATNGNSVALLDSLTRENADVKLNLSEQANNTRLSKNDFNAERSHTGACEQLPEPVWGRRDSEEPVWVRRDTSKPV